MRFGQVVLSALAVLSMANSAVAQDDRTINQFLELAKTDVTAQQIIAGAVSGLHAANARLHSRGETMLFCMPSRMSMTQEQYQKAMQDFVERMPPVGEWSSNLVGIIVLEALMYVFPCSEE